MAAFGRCVAPEPPPLDGPENTAMPGRIPTSPRWGAKNGEKSGHSGQNPDRVARYTQNAVPLMAQDVGDDL